MGKELNAAINLFLDNNDIRDCDEDYVKNFRKKFGYFISQEKLANKQDISNALIDGIKNYKYYSKKTVEAKFKDFHEEYLLNVIKMPDTIFSNISNVGNPSKFNSSNFYLTKYLEVNSLSNDRGIDIYRLLVEDKSSTKMKNISNVVLIDDFSGSGRTIISFLKKITALLEHKSIIVFCIHIMEVAEESILEFIREDTTSNQIYLKYTTKTRAALVDQPQVKERLKEFEEAELSSVFPLGYSESQALVTFYRNCPNNTLSSYWNHFEGYWSALFPRKNILIDFSEHKRRLDNVKYNLGKLQIENYDIKLLLTIIYLREYGSSAEDFEIKDILMYNGKQLQVHYTNLIEDDWLDQNKKLLPKAENYIKTNSLDSLSFSDLIKEPVDSIVKSEDALTLEDDYFSK
ncbi:phosphoribosyltransferase-like protein [Paenilisteria newyorkensis]|uniref:phosphoribosyltransferase-like protein n=1 Tax=Listeria newyorkensis TaxID=1497681 RepID=UPI000669E391|nr:hypothetical protein [Listeria newyorkensis]KMT59095.1 hypothetical protein X559_2883 [Listeria newyorkensis]